MFSAKYTLITLELILHDLGRLYVRYHNSALAGYFGDLSTHRLHSKLGEHVVSRGTSLCLRQVARTLPLSTYKKRSHLTATCVDIQVQ